MSSKIVKLPFSILAVSGYEEDFPPEGLIDHSSQSKGWQTERFCIFPQSMILKLNFGQCRIKKIQLLLHEFKIPRRVEFYSGTQELSDVSNQNILTEDMKPKISFQKLGFLAPSDNSSKSYRSRELKSIHIDFEATHLKIVFHKNYVNCQNLYNQVGILAITLLGEVMDSDYLIRTLSERNGSHYGLTGRNYKDSIIRGYINQDSIDKRILFLHDLSFDFHQDSKMIQFVSSLSEAKTEAVKKENYMLAKALKVLLNNAKQASMRISKIQIEKEKYIQDENYDEAERCKVEIENFKISLINQLESIGLHIDKDGVIYSEADISTDSAVDLSNPSKQSSPFSLKPVNSYSAQALKSLDQDTLTSLNKPADTQINVYNQLEKNSSGSIAAPITIPISSVKSNYELSSELDGKETQIQKVLSNPVLDVKPLLIARSGSPLLPAQQKLLEQGFQEQESLKPSSPTQVPSKPVLARNGSPILPAQQKLLSKVVDGQIGISTISPEKRPPDAKNAPKDLEPEQLSPIQCEKFATCIDIFHQYIVQNSLSINFKCREYGLAEVSNKIIEWRSQSKHEEVDIQSLCKATMQIVAHCMEDTREKTSVLTIGVWTQLLEAIPPHEIHDQQILNYFSNSLHALISKSGDANPRVKSNASTLLKKILQLYQKPPNSILPELLKPFDSKKGLTVHQKILKARLEILEYAVVEYGIGGRNGKFSSDSIMSFIRPLAENTHNDVRDLAYSIAAHICNHEGEIYTTTYTNSMREAQKEIFFKKLKSLGAPTSEKKNTKSEVTKKELKAKISKPKKDKEKQTDDIKKGAVKISMKPRADDFTNEADDTRTKKESSDKPSHKEKKAKSSQKVFDEHNNAEQKSSKQNACLFCEKGMGTQGEDVMEKHYSKDCPYLIDCPQCGLLVEVMLLQTHLYGGCEFAPSDPKSCNRCHALVPSIDYSSHLSKKKCKVWNIDHDPSICGLCKRPIMGRSGWKVHLLTDKGCTKNSRISNRKTKKK